MFIWVYIPIPIYIKVKYAIILFLADLWEDTL